MTRSRVDLPPPLGPSSAVSEPDGMSTETSSSATNSPNFLVMRRASIPMSGLLGPEEVHDEQREDRQRGQRERHGVGVRLLEVLEALLDVEGGRLGLADDPARHNRHRAELAEAAGQREDDAVRDAPLDGR